MDRIPPLVPSPERAALGFAAAVRAAFRFLEEEHGFRCVESGITLVRYESQATLVNVYHGRSSYELGAEVGWRDRPETREHPFTLGELIRLADPRKAGSFRLFAATRREQMAPALADLAALLARHGRAALAGDADVFERLLEERRKASEAYFRAEDLRRARDEAERAWRDRDFARVASLYGSVEEGLSPVERKRLAYARRKVGR